MNNLSNVSFKKRLRQNSNITNLKYGLQKLFRKTARQYRLFKSLIVYLRLAYTNLSILDFKPLSVFLDLKYFSRLIYPNIRKIV